MRVSVTRIGHGSGRGPHSHTWGSRRAAATTSKRRTDSAFDLSDVDASAQAWLRVRALEARSSGRSMDRPSIVAPRARRWIPLRLSASDSLMRSTTCPYDRWICLIVLADGLVIAMLQSIDLVTSFALVLMPVAALAWVLGFTGGRAGSARSRRIPLLSCLSERGGGLVIGVITGAAAAGGSAPKERSRRAGLAEVAGEKWFRQRAVTLSFPEPPVVARQIRRSGANSAMTVGNPQGVAACHRR